MWKVSEKNRSVIRPTMFILSATELLRNGVARTESPFVFTGFRRVVSRDLSSYSPHPISPPNPHLNQPSTPDPPIQQTSLKFGIDDRFVKGSSVVEVLPE